MFELRLPAPLYWHQNVFFADQAVILPAVLLILLEVVAEYPVSKRHSKALNFAQSLLAFYGTYTDWYFVFLLAVILLKRLALHQMGTNPREMIRNLALFAISPGLAIGLFAVGLYFQGILAPVER